MEVYCDLHSQSRKHVVTHLFDDRGFVGIDNSFYWPINQCFPCNEVELPIRESERVIREIFGNDKKEEL